MRILVVFLMVLLAACEKDHYICATCPANSNNSTKVTVIALSESSIEISVGEERKIASLAVCSDGSDVSQTFVWASASNSIATVSSDGTIKGVSPGEVTVRATYVDGRQLSVRVTVKNPGGNSSGGSGTPSTDNPVREIAFTGDSVITVSIGSKKMMPMPRLVMNNLSATRDLIWTSSDPTRIGVNQNTGEIAGISIGEAEICAKAKADPRFNACYPRRVRVVP